MKLDLIGPQQQGVSVVVNNQLTQNCYPVMVPNGRNPVALVGTPGTTLFSPVTGACRGLHVMDDLLYGVYGARLYRFSQGGGKSDLGAIAGSGRVDMASDGSRIVIVTGYGNPGYVYSSTGLAQITDADFPGGDSVEYSDGYFVFSSEGEEWFLSEVNSATSYNALDFAGHDGEDTLTVREDHGELFVFGPRNTRVWINTGAVDFAYERNDAAQIERGTFAKWSVAKDDNTLFFLGDDLVVYRLDGYTPVRVSDEGLETELSDYQANGYQSDLKNAYAYTYTDHGHKFYVLTVPGRGTHVFDVATGAWHSRKHFDYETHHGFSYAKAYGKHLIGGIDGNLYELSRTTYTDNGTTIIRKRRSQCFSFEDKRLRYKKIKLIMNVGNGLESGQGSSPEIMVRWSDDYGRTWSNERRLGLGAGGEYTKIVATRNCGSSRARVIEISQSDPVPFHLVDAYATIQ